MQYFSKVVVGSFVLLDSKTLDGESFMVAGFFGVLDLIWHQFVKICSVGCFAWLVWHSYFAFGE